MERCAGDCLINSADSINLAIAHVGFTIPRPRLIEEAGIYYECALIRENLSLGRDTGCALSAEGLAFILAAKSCDSQSSNSSSRDVSPQTGDEEHVFDADDEKYDYYLKALDPKSCKDQDHYKVLGLSRLRWQASDRQIRTAYRQKVLKHHPDKRRHRGLSVKGNEEDYFTCITKAYEQLGVSEQKRRAFDSVDPLFDDDIPSSLTTDNFFQLLTPVFERNARWSKSKHVPSLGDEKSDKEHVERFYSFWFDFDSWREFSYLDEEDKEKGEDRYERREIEKQNRYKRERLRKAEMKRIRSLVDMAYEKDNRVVRFRQEEKQRKEKEKRDKKEMVRLKREAVERIEREAAVREAEAVQRLKEQERERVERDRRERDRDRQRLMAQRGRLTALAQAKDYFTDSMSERLIGAEDVAHMCELFSVMTLTALSDCLESSNAQSAQESFHRHVIEVREMLEKRSLELMNANRRQRKEKEQLNNANWTSEESQLLIKAVTLFPAGTQSRWQVIATYISDHLKEGQCKPKTEKDVIKQVKAIQNMESSAKETVTNGGTGQHKLGGGSLVRPSADSESSNGQTGNNIWTAEEQRLFEQAIRTYPSSTENRWDRIAECVLGKTKKDCIRRFKELAEMVKAKKIAQAKVAKNT